MTAADKVSPDGPAATRVIHCSDLHFGDGFLPHRAEQLIEQINEHNPDGVVVSGDLTMRARSAQFAAARLFLQQIRAPLLVIPGNHDVPLYDLYRRMTDPFANYHRYTGDLGTNPLLLPHVAFYGANTVNPMRHQQGRMLKPQLETITKWLKDLPDNLWRVVVIHQHLSNIAGHERPGVMPNAAEIVETLSGAGAHAILHGHTHYNNTVSSAEFFPAIKRPLAVVCVGTATSDRVRGHTPNNNFNVLEFSRDSFVVKQYDWDQETKNFAVCRQVPFDTAFFGSK